MTKVNRVMGMLRFNGFQNVRVWDDYVYGCDPKMDYSSICIPVEYEEIKASEYIAQRRKEYGKHERSKAAN